MADKKISELDALTGATVATDDQLVIVDTSAGLTKSITIDEFKNALDTATGFVRITGDTMTGDLNFGDNDKAIFGAGSDLEIYHNGTHNIIQSNEGNITIETTADDKDIFLKSDDGSGGSATYLQVDGSTGSVNLRNYGNIKLATTSTGVDITGTLTSDGLTVDGAVDVNHNVITQSANAPRIDLIEGDTTNVNTRFWQTGGDLRIYTLFDDTTTYSERIRLDHATGDISFYEDTGTTAKLVWKAADERLGINTSSPATELDVQGTTTTNGLNLDAISDTIDDTAVDIFVYDTRKDSDGGAWRKRTQHTSWYNETLNTATRGSRKEFPAVAVIVAETSKITIYDGDDPDLPMWMVFNSESNYFLNQSTVSSVAMLNGKLAVTDTASNNTSLAIGDFVSEFCQIIRSNYDGDATGLVNRNQSFWSSDKGNTRIVNNVVNDVAMTVLPNAPIDAATGLPVPTIAVATDGGVSVIKDDGTVVDLTDSGGGQSTKVMFTQDGKLAYAHDGATSIRIDSIPSSDFGYGSSKVARGNSEEFYINSSLIASGWSGETPKILSGSFGHTGLIVPADNKYTLAQTGSNGLTRLDRSLGESGRARNMVQYTTSDYNTGWMNGDIKLATLSDTDDTDVTGSELVTNGTFDTDTTGWTGGNGATLSVVSGALRVTNDGSTSYPFAQQSITTEVGKTYTMSARGLTTPAYNWYIEVVGHGGSGQQLTEYQSHTFTASSTNTTIRLIHRGAANGNYKDFDNASVRLAEEDRSVNGNGLQVFGTVTKNPVATGADLVAYSGFSISNYLEQPYNADLQFGTGDFCYMGWVKPTTAGGWIISQGVVGSSFYGASLLFNGGFLRLYTLDTTSSSVVDGTAPTNGVWSSIAGIRRNGVLELWVNGSLIASNAVTNRNLNTANVTRVGLGTDNLSSLNGSLALLRISATAPSPEQIARIYNDEKHLFTEGAQATLYGSSDSVTALAFDDTTNLLHVGTSAGRSVFQGLRRVDNTTTAVTSAISASNGLVADE